MFNSKSIALIFGVLIMSFAISYLILAWQEPSQSPPGGNVSTPINVGTVPQAKAGRLSATEFYDYNDPNYYLNPSGQSTLQTLCFSSDCRSNWPVAIPSGMIAMFDTACPSGWTRFAALDGRFPMGASTYGGEGGQSSHAHSYSGTTGLPSRSRGEPEGYWSARADHTHSYSGNTDSASSLPPYLNVIWCKKN